MSAAEMTTERRPPAGRLGVKDGAVTLASMLVGLLEEHSVPGAVVGVVDGDMASVTAAGSRGGGRGSVDDATVFAAASLTKPVFASGVLAMVDAGVLELDRPLHEYVAEQYLPEDDRAASITARMVLSHTTGFPNWREDGPLFLRWSPGTRWGYSGEGFAYLQYVVECLTGVDLDVVMTDAVLGPLGMSDSRFVCRDEDEVRVAVGHDRDGRARPRSGASRVKAAAGGMYTTGPDYLRFLAHALAHHHRQFEPQVRIDDELSWGLGWGIEDSGGSRSIWQWGNDPGYKHFVIGRPADRQGVVVFTNGDRGASLYRDVVRRVLPGPHPSLDTRHRLRWLQATAGRPVDLRPRIDEPTVRRVLHIAQGGDHDRTGTIDLVDDTRILLFGLVVEPSWEAHGLSPGTPIACIALTRGGRREAEITAIGVLPEWRHQGFARSLIFATCDHLGLQAVEARSDAGFYRAVGFEMQRPGDHSRNAGPYRWRLELPP